MDRIVSRLQAIAFKILFWFGIVLCSFILLIIIIVHYSKGPKITFDQRYTPRYQTLADRLEGEIQKIDLDIDMDLQALGYEDELKRINTWAVMIDSAIASADPNALLLAQTLKGKVSKIQETELPRMRKRYVREAAAELWNANVYLSANDNNTVLEIASDIFSDNEWVEQMNLRIKYSAEALRFRQVNIRQRKGMAPRSIINTEAHPDTEVASITTGLNGMGEEFIEWGVWDY